MEGSNTSLDSARRLREPPRAMKIAIEKYHRQASFCPNRNCASSGKFPPLSSNEAAARAIICLRDKALICEDLPPGVDVLPSTTETLNEETVRSLLEKCRSESKWLPMIDYLDRVLSNRNALLNSFRSKDFTDIQHSAAAVNAGPKEVTAEQQQQQQQLIPQRKRRAQEDDVIGDGSEGGRVDSDASAASKDNDPDKPANKAAAVNAGPKEVTAEQQQQQQQLIPQRKRRAQEDDVIGDGSEGGRVDSDASAASKDNGKEIGSGIDRKYSRGTLSDSGPALARTQSSHSDISTDVLHCQTQTSQLTRSASQSGSMQLADTPSLTDIFDLECTEVSDGEDAPLEFDKQLTVREIMDKLQSGQ
ncbi:unnamed protein product [Gongylonema pulchrum]|uniref:AZUL domain-containing protein n=1 Tax=Gongylonema pulchrum TaxID=637853 RepID=A0A183E7V3_9BILA|nr:unnamed protein product [Gongylonema pulchrum]